MILIEYIFVKTTTKAKCIKVMYYLQFNQKHKTKKNPPLCLFQT